MINIERFNSYKELLKYQKELYTIYTDNSVYDDVKEKVLEEMLEIGDFLENTTTTNKRLIEVLLALVNTREKDYQLQILTGVKQFEKVYKYNSFEDIEVTQRKTSLSWNAVVIIDTNIDVFEFVKNNCSSSLFFRPEKHKNIYDKKLFVTYDAFLGDMKVEEYLASYVNIASLTQLSEVCGLTLEELELLDYMVMDLYKEEYSKKLNNKKLRVKKVGE